MVWAIYDITNVRDFALAAATTLTAVVLLGLTMAVRWIGVRRNAAQVGAAASAVVVIEPERNFPVPVVIAHGVCVRSPPTCSS